MADIYKALADETRRLILDELAAHDGRSLFEICTILLVRHGVDSSRQNISQHLSILEDAGLVTTEWQGRSKLHHLDRTPLMELGQRWLPGQEDPT